MDQTIYLHVYLQVIVDSCKLQRINLNSHFVKISYANIFLNKCGALEIWKKKFEIGSRHFCWYHLYLRKCNRIHHIRHISKQIMINLSSISKSFLSLYLTFLYFHCMSAHQHLRHFCEYLWRLELEFWIEKTVSQRDSSIHPLSNPLCPPRSETVFVILA